MSYRYNWEADGLYRIFYGQISGDEILESNFELHAHPDFKNIKYIINDFRDVTGHSIQTSHTNAYAVSDDVISNSKGKLKIALLVTQEPLMVLANNYRDLMKGKLFDCEIFSDMDNARLWTSKT